MIIICGDAVRAREVECEVGICSVVVCHVHLPAAMLFDSGNHSESGKIGCGVYQHVEYQRCHSERRAADDGQHDVTGLRNGRKGEEPFQILLSYGEKVGHGNTQDDNDIKHCWNVD